MSPSDATPTNRLAITSGTTTIVTSRMKTPTGSSSDAGGKRRTLSGRGADDDAGSSPTKIFVWSFIARTSTSRRRVERALDVRGTNVAHVADAKRGPLESARARGRENPARLERVANLRRRHAGGQAIAVSVVE